MRAQDLKELEKTSPSTDTRLLRGFPFKSSRKAGREEQQVTSRNQRILALAAGIVLVGFAVSEHLYRRLFERRYELVLQSQEQLESHLKQVLAANHQLLGHLVSELHRSQKLEDTVAQKNRELDQTFSRLSEAHQATLSLSGRLTTMEKQMERLQGELAVAIDTSGAAGQPARSGRNSAAAVELERIVVSRSDRDNVQGRVVSIHPDWHFIVVDLGWNQVKIGDTVSVFRNDKLLAKAKVERVQEDLAAATLLPEWQPNEVQINDLVKPL
jgi:exonuclease VII large subunit